MALRNVAEWKESVAGLLTGTNLTNVTNLDTALSRAARRVGLKVDAPESTGREPIVLYNGVYYYLAPEILFGTTVNLIRPQGNVNSAYLSSTKVPMDLFTKGKFYFPNGYMLDLEYDKGVGIIGVSSNVPLPKLELATFSNADDYTAGGSASTPITDNVNFWENPASIRFNLTGASTGTITGDISSVDASKYEGVGVVFLAIQTPSATNLTNIEARVGSSSSDYVSVTETEGFLGAWQANTWLLVAFDLSAASETGTVDWAAIDYIQVRITTGATLSNFRLGGMWVSMPSINEIIYQTAAIFKNSSGDLSNTITSDNNYIILNDAAFTILEFEGAKEVAFQMSGGVYTDQIKGFEEILTGNNVQEGLYQRYAANNPSNALRQIDSYYDGENRGYDTNYYGR